MDAKSHICLGLSKSVVKFNIRTPCYPNVKINHALRLVAVSVSTFMGKSWFMYYTTNLNFCFFCKNLASLKNDSFSIQSVYQVLEHVH